MKAAVLTEYRKVEWLDVPEPKVEDAEVLVKVGFAGICGSDQHVFNGEFAPRTRPPLIQGHEFAGSIVEAGKKVACYRVGERVAVDPIYWCGKCPACKLKHYPACSSLKLVGIDSDGGFGEYVAVREHMLYRLDESVTERHAAMIEVFAIGFHACNRAGVRQNDTVAVFGAGKIGQCILQAARTKTDNTIFVVDVLDNRLNMAKGVCENIVTINALRDGPVEVIKQRTGNRGVDIAFEAVGHAQAIEGQSHPVRQCVQVIRGGGKVCVLGLADTAVPLVMKELIFKEAKLITSRVSAGEFAEAIEHMAKGDLKPEALISTEMPASQAQQAFELLEKQPQDYLKILLRLC